MSCKESTKKANNLLRQYSVTIQNPDFQPAIETLSYLIKCDDISTFAHSFGTEDWSYHCFESILLDFGQFFKVGKSGGMKRRTDIDYRFKYSASQQSKSIIYCEGVVLRPDGFAFEHAWNLDIKSGEIIDAFCNGQAYFGIPFTSNFVHQFNFGNGVFSPDNSIELLEYGLPKGAIWKPLS